MRWALLFLTACETPAALIAAPLDGKVVDIWGNPIEGATVMVVDGTERPLTDSDGRYRIARADGPLQFKAGKHGYIQDHQTVVVGPDTKAAPLFELYPKPESNGYWIVGTGKYHKISPQPVKLRGSLKPFRGIEEIGDTPVDQAKPRIVLHTDLRHDELLQLGLDLHRLDYVRKASVMGPTGAAEVDVNLYVAKESVPVDLIPLRSKTDYLVTPKQPLESGVYALVSLDLLTGDMAAFDAVFEELRYVLPFRVP